MMKTIILDGEKMKTKREAHEYMSKAFDFPQYYGKNLDALWDILSVYDVPIHIVFKNAQAFKNNLEEYGNRILKVFLDAKEDNGNLSIEVEE